VSVELASTNLACATNHLLSSHIVAIPSKLQPQGQERRGKKDVWAQNICFDRFFWSFLNWNCLARWKPKAPACAPEEAGKTS